MLGRLRQIGRGRAVLAALLMGIAGALFALALSWRPAIAPITPPSPGSFTPEQVARGAVLAKIGDCAVCHTRDNGRPLAGGRPLATPFGTLYSDNLTPDPETGIGTWSAAAFRRAMKDGVSRTGEHLYPALPYEHFTHVRDADLDALYAFLMMRRPVHEAAPANRLIFPLGFRPLLAGWKLLFLHHGETPTDSSRSAEWNRGAYLVEGLGHCGGCHTPRNLAGGEIRSQAYAGGIAEGWRAPPLNAANPAARKWTQEALVTYLRTGISPDHSAAAGPMGPVVDSLSQVPESEVRAIAAYIVSKMGGSPSGPVAPLPDHAEAAASRFPEGAVLFAGACAGCHGQGAPMMGQGRPLLSLATALRDTEPNSAAQAILQGIEPPVAGRGPKMPGFADALTDRQIAAVLGYARARYTDRPDWKKLPAAVAKARKEGTQP
ncbi:c-type cytochrome [Stakelama pacifica]|uniref:Mono/diheme cytochrome c family protein n=1 Tax=Stakelama pacifica TaxID=517720 RepID=A0A4R6FEI6_9SPHN|nr:c-type cytochrome [Stakelama pacifica]TDN78744.1 mono/diheme cytochrome c family protein [Stakelama pacifica]GGO99234.1 cytochrome c [Stakelama pacifica]